MLKTNCYHPFYIQDLGAVTSQNLASRIVVATKIAWRRPAAAGGQLFLLSASQGSLAGL